MAVHRKLVGLLYALGLACGASVQAVQLYGMDAATDSLLAIDTRTGVANVIGNLPGIQAPAGGLAFDRSGRLYVEKYIVGLYSVNPRTATGYRVGLSGHEFQSLEIIRGKGYSQDPFDHSLYEIDLHTGVATRLVRYNGPGNEFITGLAAIKGVLYGTIYSEPALVKVFRSTGGRKVIGHHGLANVNSLAFADGVFWTIPYGSSALYSIDPLTGAATLVQSQLAHAGNITGLTGPPPIRPVPEPGTLVLSLFSVPILLAWYSRRRRGHARQGQNSESKSSQACMKLVMPELRFSSPGSL